MPSQHAVLQIAMFSDCKDPVKLSGSSLTNESAEAITRPSTTRCGARRTVEDASDYAVREARYTRKQTVSDVPGDIKSLMESNRRSATIVQSACTYVQRSLPPLLSLWAPGVGLQGSFLKWVA